MPNATVVTSSQGVNSGAPYWRDVWSGRGGGRHYRLYTAMAEQARQYGGTLRAGHRDLYLMANVSSHRGLSASLTHLIEAGLIEVIEQGSSDVHTPEGERSPGKASLYRIRQRGTPVCDSSDESTSHGQADRPSVVEDINGAHGSSPLAKIDRNADCFVEEPHLLRIVDQMVAERTERMAITPTGLASRLGLAISSCWKMIRRLEAAGYLNPWGELDLRLIAQDRSTEVSGRIIMQCQRARRIRSEALAGRWMPRRIRVAQRFRTVGRGRFRFVDFIASLQMQREHQTRFESGGLPWVPDDELDEVWRRLDAERCMSVA